MTDIKENTSWQTVYEQLQEFLNKYPWNYKLTIDHFIEAMRIAYDTNKIAATMLQRKMALWFATSAYLLDTMEKFWFIWLQNWVRPRDIHIEKIWEYLSNAKLPTKSE